MKFFSPGEKLAASSVWTKSFLLLTIEVDPAFDRASLLKKQEELQRPFL
ncbi:hypothetical protein [Variovorax paradoxus]|nr:hypothetical protein [Variovorax paradoxus]MDP9932893.1 hypothetical protein [Variovorax paradoxus]